MKAIAAMAANRVIGRNNKLPWHLKEDLKHFKALTKGQSVVMGRKTFESAGPLPDRHIFVLSSKFPNPEFDAHITALEEKVRNCKITPISKMTDIPSDAWICGGASVYEQTLELCTDLHLTFIDKMPEGDAHMPWFEDDFQLMTAERYYTANDVGYEFRHYLNRLIYEQ